MDVYKLEAVDNNKLHLLVDETGEQVFKPIKIDRRDINDIIKTIRDQMSFARITKQLAVDKGHEFLVTFTKFIGDIAVGIQCAYNPDDNDTDAPDTFITLHQDDVLEDDCVVFLANDTEIETFISDIETFIIGDDHDG